MYSSGRKLTHAVHDDDDDDDGIQHIKSCPKAGKFPSSQLELASLIDSDSERQAEPASGGQAGQGKQWLMNWA